MKRKHKGISSLITILVILLSSLVACGKADTVSSQKTPVKANKVFRLKFEQATCLPEESLKDLIETAEGWWTISDNYTSTDSGYIPTAMVNPDGSYKTRRQFVNDGFGMYKRIPEQGYADIPLYFIPDGARKLPATSAGNFFVYNDTTFQAYQQGSMVDLIKILWVFIDQDGTSRCYCMNFGETAAHRKINTPRSSNQIFFAISPGGDPDNTTPDTTEIRFGIGNEPR